MIKGRTSTGFNYEFNSVVMKDARFIEKLAALSDEDLSGLTYILNAILGEKQKEKLYDHVAKSDSDHIANIKTVIAEITEMIQAAGEEEKK